MRGNEYFVSVKYHFKEEDTDRYYAAFEHALGWARFRATRGFRRWYIKRLRDGIIIAQARGG